MIFIENGQDITTDVVYSNTKSRPSKSLLTPELYKKKDINTPFNIYEKLIDSQLKEVSKYFNRNSDELIDKFITNTNFSKIIEFINNNCCSLCYKLNNLHTSVNVEFVILTSSVFKKITVYFSKFDR